MIGECVLLVAGAILAAPRGDVDSLQVIREAYRSAAEGWQTATGEFHFSEKNREKGDAPLRVREEGAGTFVVAGTRYFVDLTFAGEEPAYSKRVVVFDGNVLASSRFSERINPFGAEGQIFEQPEDVAGVVVPSLARFKWDIARLPAQVLNVDHLLGALSRDQIEVTREANGDILMRYRITDQVRGECVFAESAGFHVSAHKTLNKGWELPATEVAVQWDRFDGVWWIRSVIETNRYNTGEEAVSELSFDSIVPGAEVEDGSFGLDRLGLPAGARIIDGRPKAAGDARVHYVKVPEAKIEKELRGMAAEFAALPTTRNGSSANRDLSQMQSALPLTLILANVVVACALLILWFARRRRGTEAK